VNVRNRAASWSGGIAMFALLIFGSSGASFASTTITDIVRLVASDADSNERFGHAVGLDGDTMVVGAHLDDVSGAGSGAAYIFVRSGGGWVEQAKLVPADLAAGDEFGRSVALSGDTVLVGSRFDDDAGMSSGSAYVFVRSGSTWTQQAKLTASDAAASAYFGVDVAIDGDTAAVGAFFDTTALPQTGSAYVFMRSGGTWTETAKLVAPDGRSEDRFGARVEVQQGDVIFVGASFHGSSTGDRTGAVYTFVPSGGSWVFQQKLTASDPAALVFGASIGIDGHQAVVTSFSEAWVFRRIGGVWVEQARLAPPPGLVPDGYGHGADISGNTIAVGAPIHDIDGKVFFYGRSGSGWVEQAQIDSLPDSGFGDWLGASVALDGELGVAGAPLSSQAARDGGSAVAFRMITAGDADGDGLPDAIDPDTVGEIVTSFDPGSFAATGHPTALLSRLEEVERMILAGDIAGAIRHLEDLLRRLDGCPDSPTAGESADRNDWITDCDDQRALRAAIEALILALSAP
jgi:hypothetical protein